MSQNLRSAMDFVTYKRGPVGSALKRATKCFEFWFPKISEYISRAVLLLLDLRYNPPYFKTVPLHVAMDLVNFHVPG